MDSEALFLYLLELEGKWTRGEKDVTFHGGQTKNAQYHGKSRHGRGLCVVSRLHGRFLTLAGEKGFCKVDYVKGVGF